MRQLILLLTLVFFAACEQTKFKTEWTREVAPEVFTAKFETTKGDFTITVERHLSPKAADRFYQLVKHGYYDNGIFYRVVKDFVAQFGNTDTLVMNQWRKIKIPDEPVRLGNLKGTVSFARDGKETRDLDLFINLKDNSVLDTLNYQGVKGFPAFGKVTSGMENVEKLYSGYGEDSMDDENLYQNRGQFYTTYPKLDLIEKAYIAD
ncbi:peptidylprolyl isomerase [Flavobacterium sp. CYK-4]|uniref:peptidylprolyl isomerase n=1 Tax=Flavobacterium lotistagni TaxID=2709660 RepID=UPI00140DF6E8|nr:peptidylprolyl isomerase [Flavobacterium lotistagni]NHM08150.1 peptidylprolyl isomerase [Flavobacterium lotistagni]